MRIPRFYTDLELTANAEIELGSNPSQHIAKVLRMRPGDALILFNGLSGSYAATIRTVAKKSVCVTTGDYNDAELESPLAVELGIGISKGDRFDWVVQKATELGVSSISPLFSERTEVKLKAERLQKKLQHWQQIAISACEQCGRNRLPTIHSPQPIEAWLNKTEAEVKFVLHHRALQSQNAIETPKTAALLVGPEGGLSTSEINLAEQQGFQSLLLGPRVLRTETAPLAVLTLLQSRWGDMPF